MIFDGCCLLHVLDQRKKKTMLDLGVKKHVELQLSIRLFVYRATENPMWDMRSLILLI